MTHKIGVLVMKKISAILIICLVVCMGLAIFAGCETKFGPIGTTEYKDSPVINNGGLAKPHRF